MVWDMSIQTGFLTSGPNVCPKSQPIISIVNEILNYTNRVSSIQNLNILEIMKQ